VEIKNNVALYGSASGGVSGGGNGGGVYKSGDSGSIATTGSTGIFISGNQAIGSGSNGGNGGGICNDAFITTSPPSSSMIIDPGTINGNSATNNGGGIYTNRVTTINLKCLISGNTALGNGGGIYNALSPTVEFSGAQICGNYAVGDGGGIYTARGAIIPNNVIIGGSIALSSNAAEDADRGNAAGGNGGGIYGLGGTITINGTINNNIATLGGGIYGTGTVTINSGSSITNNTAHGADDEGGSGGGIYLTNPTNLRGTGGTFSNNTAPQPYWLLPSDTYLTKSGLDIDTHIGSSGNYSWMKNGSYSASPIGDPSFLYIYNNFDVNWGRQLCPDIDLKNIKIIKK